MTKYIISILFLVLFFCIGSFFNVNGFVLNQVLKYEDYDYKWISKNIYSLNESEFESLIKDKYVYSEKYDCKYWAYLYYNYYKGLGYETKYIYSFKYKHILVSAFKKGKYKIVDNSIFNEYKISFIE